MSRPKTTKPASRPDKVEAKIRQLAKQAEWNRRMGQSDWEERTLIEGYKTGVLSPEELRWNPFIGEKPSPEYVASLVTTCRWLSVKALEQNPDSQWHACFPCRSNGAPFCGGPEEVLK